MKKWEQDLHSAVRRAFLCAGVKAAVVDIWFKESYMTLIINNCAATLWVYEVPESEDTKLIRAQFLALSKTGEFDQTLVLPTPPEYVCSSYGDRVWVNSKHGCVARFGDSGGEVYLGDGPPEQFPVNRRGPHDEYAVWRAYEPWERLVRGKFGVHPPSPNNMEVPQ